MTMNRDPRQSLRDRNHKRYNSPLQNRGLNRRKPYNGETPLRDKQVLVVAFLRDYTVRYSYPHMMREIVARGGVSSTSVALCNLRILNRKPGIARGTVLIQRGRAWSPSVPISPFPEDAA